jgi:CRP-like cAMP-binding protein
MHELFFKDFNRKVGLTGEEQQQVAAYLTGRKLRKRQYLLQEGDVCKAVAFVEKGVLREYSLGEDGIEHVVQFALEGWHISDMYSFLTGEPATHNIDVIEDAEVTLISREAYEEMLVTVPKFETLMRLNITGAYLALRRRLASSIRDSLESRYQTFITTYPDIVQRVPQHMIASYLGATPETLSRLRKRLAGK